MLSGRVTNLAGHWLLMLPFISEVHVSCHVYDSVAMSTVKWLLCCSKRICIERKYALLFTAPQLWGWGWCVILTLKVLVTTVDAPEHF